MLWRDDLLELPVLVVVSADRQRMGLGVEDPLVKGDHVVVGEQQVQILKSESILGQLNA